jgi:hypothetical protein
MQRADRKAAIAAYKERKVAIGVFAVRCTTTGEVWVGPSTHLDTQKNGIWFMLRQGSHLNRELQAAWTRHGEDTFRFETLEQLEPEENAYLRRAALKERAAYWRDRLSALAL